MRSLKAFVGGWFLLLVSSAVWAQDLSREAPHPAASSTATTAPHRVPLASQDGEVESLKRQIAEQQAKIVRLEAKLPTTLGDWVWFVVGMGGQFIFFLRFVVQWIASERRKRTVVPMAFWYLSLGGTVLVLSYAMHRVDPVFILAYSLNIFLYVRNLYIAKRSPEIEAVMEKESE